MRALRRQLSYGNVVATLALFIALGGTSYAVLHVGSSDVMDNSLRSRDIRNGTLLSRDLRDRSIRARDVRPNVLGAREIRESTLGVVARAAEANRVGGATADDLKTKCPSDTVKAGGACIETAERGPAGFLTALNICDQAGRALISMTQLDPFLRSRGLLPQPEWTSSVYRNPDYGPTAVEQLETVVLQTNGDPSYDRVYFGAQHAFRCVALPSN
jgi:hypothetical protein